MYFLEFVCSFIFQTLEAFSVAIFSYNSTLSRLCQISFFLFPSDFAQILKLLELQHYIIQCIKIETVGVLSMINSAPFLTTYRDNLLPFIFTHIHLGFSYHSHFPIPMTLNFYVVGTMVDIEKSTMSKTQIFISM